jgi:nitrile hydratase
MPDHQPERPHDPEHDHSQSHLSEMELRVRSLESVLTQKCYVEPAALDLLIETYEKKIGPHNGARVVAKAWVDEDFKQRLLAEPTHLIASLGYAGFQGENMVVVENTPKLHDMVVCTLCSCYPWSVLGFRRSGTNRRPIAREQSWTPEACCAILGWNFLPTRKSACGIRPPKYGISSFQCVQSGPRGGAKNASHPS